MGYKSNILYNISEWLDEIPEFPDISSLDDILNWLENLLSSGIISEYMLYLILLSFIFFAMRMMRRGRPRPIVRVDLAPVLVDVDGHTRKGIIDLNDPSGHYLKLLYIRNNNVSSIVIDTSNTMQVQKYTCIYSTVDQPTVYLAFNSLPSLPGNDVQGHTLFFSPNRLVWNSLRQDWNLRIHTGYDQHIRAIEPNYLNINNIRVIGIQDVYDARFQRSIQ